MKRCGQLEREDSFGNHDAREEKHADARAGDEAAIETLALAEESQAEKMGEQRQRDHCESEWQASGEGILPADGVGGCDEPVVQRRLFEVAHAVHVHYSPVATLEHFARD